MFEDKDTINNLSFAPDGKKVVFDRCHKIGCQIQVYNLETGELAAYKSPLMERWTMGKYSDDGKRITFSVIPIKLTGGLDLGEMQIVVMDADGKNYKKVTTGPGAKLYPTFSHNGKKILYACAARIREKGKTPAADYDAWEVDLATGKQTRRTYFEYFYMGNLTYFPDDERFIYYGELPSVLEGESLSYSGGSYDPRLVELGSKGLNIMNVVVMKGKALIPNPYHFPPKTFPGKPLLSKVGSILIYEKSQSGDFYLYSQDDNHRLIGSGGSVSSAAISSDGLLLGVISADYILQIFNVRESSLYKCVALAENKPKRDYGPMRNKINKIFADKPKYILNQ